MNFKVTFHCESRLNNVISNYSVWNSWKNEQRFVKFYLKKSSSISFRHNQPSKSLRNRRKRPNFIGAQETFIDGPTGLCQFNHEETSAATSESTSGTTTSGDTFGSPSELSLTTTTTTTTTTESNESDSDQHCNRSTNQGIIFWSVEITINIFIQPNCNNYL